MERPQKSQLAKVFLLVFFLTLLFLTPFISTSMRSSYLYFLLNLLIIVLGAEAGFLTAISKPSEEKKPAVSIVNPPVISSSEPVTTTASSVTSSDTISKTVENNKVVATGVVTRARVGDLKRCKSRPSLFFIGCFDEEEEVEVEKKEEFKEVMAVKVVEEAGELSKQELFMKAEMFIGNFYKQLKMQRENSWQKLHGLYQKAF